MKTAPIILALVLLFLAGVFNGCHETIHYHFGQFQRHHPNAKSNFWDPQQSWVNKYKNNDPDQGPKFFLSTTALAWATDAKHLLGTGFRWFLVWGIIFLMHFSRPRKWQGLALVFVLAFTCMNAGFHLIYSLIY